ncbi:hypothetical protein VKT23_002427 [Stygiomarasmius scandens]|uniref:HIT-type domain-containing protein n=1 Tax=Marasmiellus scandens TaxID=2682957 RepID=A0ABR1K362_9AGAR
MPPRCQRRCQVCEKEESKYNCPKCPMLYCSVTCYKTHKESNCGPEVSTSTTKNRDTSSDGSNSRESLEEPKPLRPLTSLKWPYVPEESAYPDPLERDDPKPLQPRHYEAIGQLVIFIFSPVMIVIFFGSYFTCHSSSPGLVPQPSKHSQLY